MKLRENILRGNPFWMKLETIKSKNDWNIKKVTQSKQINGQSHNRSTTTRWEICSKLTIKTPERRHWPRSDVFKVNFTYFKRFFSASIVNFEQVNVSQEPVSWISIYPRAEGVIALLSLLLILLLLFYC